MFERMRFRFMEAPFYGALFIAIYASLSKYVYSQEFVGEYQTLAINSYFKNPVGDNIVQINKSNASFIENKMPNVVFRSLVTKPFTLDIVQPFQVVGELGNDAVIPTETEIKQFALSAKAFLTHMRNVFVTNEGIVISDNTFYPDQCDCHWRVCNDFRAKNFPQSFSYTAVESAVAVMHEYGWFFAHWMCDFLPRLLVIPDEILQKSKIIVTNGAGFAYKALSFVNLTSDHLLAPSPGSAVFCQNLYTVDPLYCTHFVGYLLINMRNKFKQKAYLDSNQPTEYIFYNRENAEFRNIGNYDEILKAIKANMPECNWKNVNIPSGLIEQARLFNSFKVFFAMHGAAFSNTLFMQPNTCVVEIQVDRWVDNYLWITAYAKVHHILTRDKSIQWRSGGGANNLTIPLITKLARQAHETVLKSFPKNH